ncbi:MAG: ADP-ribosylglycohydrolase family protein, partial [bacterium]
LCVQFIHFLNVPVDLQQKFQGALLGTFVGDALGMPVEGWSPKAIAKRYGQVRDMLDARLGKGTYTDDTQMMIAVTESLVGCHGFDGEDMAQRFLESYEPLRGYGSGTVQALKLLEEGVPWNLAGRKVFEGGSFGNGAAMRIAPIGLFYYDDPYELREKAYLASQITHAHSLGKESAALQAFAVARALLANPEDSLDVIAFWADLKEFVEPEATDLLIRLEHVRKFLSGQPEIETLVSTLGNDSRGFASVPAAIFAFLSHWHSFEEAVVYAVSLGGDTDTIGAMTGAIAGAFHGISKIPGRWLDDLENDDKGRDYVIKQATLLYETKMKIV